MAVLEFFRREPGDADEPLMEAISAAASIVGPHLLRVRAEEASRLCEERYRLLAEGASDMIARIGPDESIRYVSAAARALTGFAPEEMIGRPWSMFFHPDDRAEVKRVRETAPDVFSLQYRGRRKDGDWVWFESTGRTIRDAATGAVQEFSTVTRDITERKRLETGLLHSQKMEAIGRLAGGVAHDFNNLLTVITGYVELAIKTLPPGDPIRADLAEVKKAGDRAASLTRQLLAFGRSQVLNPQPLDLNVVVLEMERMLRRLIGEDIELSTALAPVLGEVRADPGQIEQVIMNLVVNARDAIQQLANQQAGSARPAGWAGSARPKGGRLSIETGEVDLDDAYVRQHVGVKPGRYVMLAVSDNGRGMDAETLSHLFEPFFTTKGLGQGTGLGLSTVYGIVRQSGGHIWVYSEPSRGSTFRIYFPRAHRGRRPAPRKKEREGDLRGTETVLLVEDEEMVRSLACEILGRFGYHVLPAKSAGDAMKSSRGHKGTIHLLVTDVVMPRVGGPELASRLRHEREGIRVLYMSGYTENALLHQGALPADTILLQKPFTADALARKVREALA